MNTYEYTAATAEGGLVTGRAWASDEVELDRDLETRGLTLTKSTVVVSDRRLKRHKLTRDDLITMTTQLATVSSAGVHLVEGLSGIGERMQRNTSRLLVQDLVNALRAGQMLSEAMDKHPQSFPPVYRATVRAGEASGALDRVLTRLARYLEWVRGMRATTLAALIYPGILFFALFGLVMVLLYFVLPRIIGLFPGGREQLPGETRALLAISDFLTEQWLPLALAAGLTIGGFAWAKSTLKGRIAIDRALLAIPKLGHVLRQIAVSKFASTASILQQAGCDVFTVIGVSGSTCGNAAIGAAFERVNERVRRGETITQALEREQDLDPLLVQMVSIGEKTGSLDTCLAKLVEYYDEQIPRTVKKFLTILEPAMLMGAGVVVAFILLAALMPIFEMYENIG